MARARIVHTFEDGSTTEMSMTIEDSFPDAADEARAQVVKLWRETCRADAEAE